MSDDAFSDELFRPLHATLHAQPIGYAENAEASKLPWQCRSIVCFVVRCCWCVGAACLLIAEALCACVRRFIRPLYHWGSAAVSATEPLAEERSGWCRISYMLSFSLSLRYWPCENFTVKAFVTETRMSSKTKIFADRRLVWGFCNALVWSRQRWCKLVSTMNPSVYGITELFDPRWSVIRTKAFSPSLVDWKPWQFTLTSTSKLLCHLLCKVGVDALTLSHLSNHLL